MVLEEESTPCCIKMLLTTLSLMIFHARLFCIVRHVDWHMSSTQIIPLIRMRAVSYCLSHLDLKLCTAKKGLWSELWVFHHHQNDGGWDSSFLMLSPRAEGYCHQRQLCLSARNAGAAESNYCVTTHLDLTYILHHTTGWKRSPDCCWNLSVISLFLYLTTGLYVRTEGLR